MLFKIYKVLFKYNGHQKWWPGETDFEVCVGAVLTQNTAWTNVEKAISELKAHKLLDPKRMLKCPQKGLSRLIRSSGYFNQKAGYLHELCRALKDTPLNVLKKGSLLDARTIVLDIKGVGKETADSIMLYALGFPVFVIDAYTKRIFSRIGLVEQDITYDKLQILFHKELKTDVELFKDYHAQLVVLGKNYCRKEPKCEKCPLRKEKLCKYAR